MKFLKNDGSCVFQQLDDESISCISKSSCVVWIENTNYLQRLVEIQSFADILAFKSSFIRPDKSVYHLIVCTLHLTYWLFCCCLETWRECHSYCVVLPIAFAQGKLELVGWRLTDHSSVQWFGFWVCRCWSWGIEDWSGRENHFSELFIALGCHGVNHETHLKERWHFESGWITWLRDENGCLFVFDGSKIENNALPWLWMSYEEY